MILITGAGGFIGRRLVERLRAEDRPIRVALRRPDQPVPAGVERVHVRDLTADTDWRAALAGVSAVIHLAARVHVMRDPADDPIAEYRKVNVAATVALARAAAAAGVRRFIFLSSVKVNGESTAPGVPFTEADPRAPEDPYATSKAEAEAALFDLAASTAMELVVIRPPLVYGPGARANILSMMRWLARGIPLPLGAVRANRRSLVALDNLVDLVVTVAAHPAAANQVFLVSDGEDLSTADLLRRTAAALGVPARLLPVPVPVLRWGAFLAGRRDLARRLCGNLQVSIQKAGDRLGWHPPISVDEGLRRAAAAFR